MTSDHLLILAFLRGYIAVDERGLPAKKYLSRRSEAEAIVGLVKLLRSAEPLPRAIRDALADLLEEKPNCENQTLRVLKVEFRKKGKRRDELRDTEISNHVLRRILSGDPVEAAVASAVECFHTSRPAVFRIWKRHKPIYVAMGWLKSE